MRTIFVAVSLTLAAATAHADPAPTHPLPDSTTFEYSFSAGPGRLGIAAVKISPELRAHYGAPADRGVLVDSVRPDGVAARAGIRTGDIMLEVDGKPVRGASDVIGAMAGRRKGDTISIEVMRSGAPTRLTATLDRDPAPAGHPRSSGFSDRDMQRWMQEMPRVLGPDPRIERLFDEMRRRLEMLERRMDDGKQLPGADRQRTRA